MGQLLKQLREHGAELGLGQVLRDATVLAVPENQGILALAPAPMQVESVGVGEDVLVAVGRLVGGDYALAGFDVLGDVKLSPPDGDGKGVRSRCVGERPGLLDVNTYLAAWLDVDFGGALHG